MIYKCQLNYETRLNYENEKNDDYDEKPQDQEKDEFDGTKLLLDNIIEKVECENDEKKAKSNGEKEQNEQSDKNETA